MLLSSLLTCYFVTFNNFLISGIFLFCFNLFIGESLSVEVIIQEKMNSLGLSKVVRINENFKKEGIVF